MSEITNPTIDSIPSYHSLYDYPESISTGYRSEKSTQYDYKSLSNQQEPQEAQEPQEQLTFYQRYMTPVKNFFSPNKEEQKEESTMNQMQQLHHNCYADSNKKINKILIIMTRLMLKVYHLKHKKKRKNG